MLFPNNPEQLYSLLGSWSYSGEGEGVKTQAEKPYDDSLVDINVTNTFASFLRIRKMTK